MIITLDEAKNYLRVDTADDDGLIENILTAARRLCIDDLNIRRGPGTNHDKVGVYTGKGVFTIIEVADGPGAIKWGLLKSYADKRNGWISLDYAERL